MTIGFVRSLDEHRFKRDDQDDIIRVGPAEGVSKEVLETVERATVVGNIAIGVGGFYIFDLVARQKGIQVIVMLDPAPSAVKFWEEVTSIVVNSWGLLTV